MRVASSTLYQQGLASMNLQQGSLLHIQQQLGTGRRVLTPSDDPVAATRALGVSQAQAVNGQYATSRSQANIALAAEENALRAKDRAYWQPLREELSQWRRGRTRKTKRVQ